MEKFSLVIKGNAFDAFRATDLAGIHPDNIRKTAERDCNQTVMVVYATTGTSNYEKISAWFNATNYSDSIPGFGYPVGSLLYYSAIAD